MSGSEDGTGPRKWLYGLTADEWLHLAAEGEESEVAPCCANLSDLREWLNALATCQGEGESWIAARPVLNAYDIALASHDGLADDRVFPLLSRVIAGVRQEASP